jgi:hypothetical protein
MYLYVRLQITDAWLAEQSGGASYYFRYLPRQQGDTNCTTGVKS